MKLQKKKKFNKIKMRKFIYDKFSEKALQIKYNKLLRKIL